MKFLLNRKRLPVDGNLHDVAGRRRDAQRQTVSRRMGVRRDLISSLERALHPPLAFERKRRSEFESPVLDFAAVIFRIKMNKAVRILPVETGNQSVQSNRFCEVVRGGAVVCGNGG